MNKQFCAAIMVFAISLVGLLSCSMNREEMQNQIKTSFQQKMDSDSQYSKYKMIANSVTLVKSGNNTYDGMVNITLDGQQYDVAISVTADNDTFIWQTKPMAFSFLAEYELKKLGF